MINGQILKQAIISGANNICSQKARINDLNIFPVPDGDTGTNMSMTVMAAVKEIEKMDNDDVATIAKKTASAMLRGARGNSGVITSLFFRGFANGLEGKKEASGKDLADALALGVDAAYKAVMKPTEGTMLTVGRMAAEAAVEATAETEDVVEIWEIVCEEAQHALDLTPTMLPVLKKAGVVDAGGKGILVIFEGMLSVIKDGVVIEAVDAADDDEEAEDAFRSAAAEFDDDITFTYCTEFIVGRDAEIATEPNELRLFLETIGDCVVVVDDEEIIKVHVHTEQPGDALKKGLEFGSLLTVKVENMKEQHKQAKADNESKKPAKAKKKLEVAEPVEDFGFVAVAAGDGVTELFEQLGCANVVSGGQSMNPSTDDIYEAVMATPAKTVFVLPNNKNIIMAAEQTQAIVEDREVVIVPTRTIPQGMSAMLVFDADADADTNREAMIDAASNVSTGQVTYAARDSEFGMKKIKEGEIIALENGKLTVTDKTVDKALLKLAKNMIDKDKSFVTLISGEDVTEEEAQNAYEMLCDKFGDDVDITFVSGGQPIYYYILSVE
ncbi:MAG: DAK2 domain-containing protein [Ruminococcus sp.]|nr:DAK2 domain-containing protein [Ruminococcus sp.]